MATDERWLPIKGYEELYLISNFGRVMNKATSRVLRIRYTRGGYARVNLSKNGQIKTHRIHRLVGEHFVPNPLNLPEINHINEVKADNRAENLEWCDRSYNVNFGTVLKGRGKRFQNLSFKCQKTAVRLLGMIRPYRLKIVPGLTITE